ncbi:MAG: hypothetical protein RQ824_04635, partial [bacterium]|nr:hypothetical protein [bacterium]
MKRLFVAFLFFLALAAYPEESRSATNQYGETGLLSTPSAEMVGAGNLCVGIWCNFSDMKDGSSETLMPISFVFGIGQSFELNASYPNVLFNDDAEENDRGYMNLGFKKRLMGTNRSKFKLALSGAMLKPITSDSARSDLTDYTAKVLIGARSKYAKLHLGAGYRQADETGLEIDPPEDQTFVDGAIDIAFYRRFRVFLEGEWRSAATDASESSTRFTPGVQIFLTPHLTFSLGVDYNSLEAAPEQRVIAGLSTCGGIGEYIVAIPKPPKPIIAEAEKPRGKPPIPLLPKMIKARWEKIETEKLEPVKFAGTGEVAPTSLAVAGKYEVPVLAEELDITLPSVTLLGAGAVPGSLAPAVGSIDVLEPSKPLKGRALRKFRIPELMFDLGKWTIKAESTQAIGVISAELLKTKGPFFVKIEGH